MQLRKLLLALFIIGAQLTFFSQTKNSTFITPPSDIPGATTYDFDKARNLIISRLEKPDAANKDAEALVSESSFPKLSKGEKVDNAYMDKLKVWMEKNPNLIISTLKNRKEIVHEY